MAGQAQGHDRTMAGQDDVRSASRQVGIVAGRDHGRRGSNPKREGVCIDRATTKTDLGHVWEGSGLAGTQSEGNCVGAILPCPIRLYKPEIRPAAFFFRFFTVFGLTDRFLTVF